LKKKKTHRLGFVWKEPCASCVKGGATAEKKSGGKRKNNVLLVKERRRIARSICPKKKKLGAIFDKRKKKKKLVKREVGEKNLVVENPVNGRTHASVFSGKKGGERA